jgi:hypothetical protein
MAFCLHLANQMKKRACLSVVVPLFFIATQLRPATAQPIAVVTKNEKSHDLAVGLSLGGTALGVGMFLVAANRSGSASGEQALLGATSLVIATGPSWGRWYAGELSLPTIGIRTVTIATVALFASASGDEPPPSSFFKGCAFIIAGTTLYDIYRAKTDTDEYNVRHSDRSNQMTYSINPVVVPSTKGVIGGLALQGTF